MVVVLREGATSAQRDEIARMLRNPPAIEYIRPVRSVAGEVFCVPTSAMRPGVRAQLARHPAVARLIPISTSYQLASKALSPVKTRVKVGEVVFGGGDPIIIAGPCSVESEEQIFEAARFARGAGAHLLRGGAFKPRTSPYSFQGLGEEGLKILARVREETGMPVVTEATDIDVLDQVAEYADMVQVGARNMQNYTLLKRVGRCGRPVLLKRGMTATVTELLLSAEYILDQGNTNVVLCERGI